MDLSGDVAPDDPPVSHMTPSQTPSKATITNYAIAVEDLGRLSSDDHIMGICTGSVSGPFLTSASETIGTALNQSGRIPITDTVLDSPCQCWIEITRLLVNGEDV